MQLVQLSKLQSHIRSVIQTTNRQWKDMIDVIARRILPLFQPRFHPTWRVDVVSKSFEEVAFAAVLRVAPVTIPLACLYAFHAADASAREANCPAVPDWN